MGGFLMSKYNERSRMTLEQALKKKAEPTNMISHLMRNEDETYSLVYHINCEFCDYCEEGIKKEPYLAKENIYEEVEK